MEKQDRRTHQGKRQNQTGTAKLSITPCKPDRPTSRQTIANLQAILNETITKLNERFTETQRRFDIKSRYDKIEINGPNEFQLRIDPDFEKHELSLRIWRGEERQPRFNRTVSLDLNDNGEVRYVDQGHSVSVQQLAESILEILVNYSL